MAVWNVVKSSNLSRTYRIDPEYYQLHYFQLLGHLKKSGSQRLSSAVDVIRNKFSPQANNIFEYIEISRVSTTLGTYESIQVRDDAAPSRAQYLVPKGSVLLSTVRPNRSAVALVTNPSPRTVCSSGFLVLKPRQVSPEYLFAFLKTKYLTGLLVRETTATMYPAVAEEDVLSLPFLQPAPGLHERVTNLVRKAHLELERAGQLYSQAESLLLAELGLDGIDLSHSLFYEARYSETIEAGRMDAECFATDPLRQWRSPYPTRSLGELAEKIENGMTPASSEYSENGVPILKVGGLLSKGEISWLGDRVSVDSKINKTSKGLARPNEVFVLCAAHHVRYIGKSGILWEVPEDKEFCRYVGELIGIQCSRQVMPEFLTVYLNLPPVLHSIQRLVRGLSAHLYPQDLETLPVPLLPDSVQCELASMLRESHTVRKESKRLTDEAVRTVEEAILEQ